MLTVFVFLIQLLTQSLAMGALIQAFFTIFLGLMPNSPFRPDSANDNGDPGTGSDPQCVSAADCDDADACTTDLCSNGVCQNDVIPNCPAPQMFEIITTADGSGRIETDIIGDHANAGDTVTFTAIPTVCSTFDGWEGDLSGIQNPQSLTINSDVDVTAMFTDVGSVGLSGSWSLSRVVNGFGGSIECLIPLRGSQDEVTAVVIEGADTLEFSFALSGDSDSNGLVDASPGQIWFANEERCDPIEPFQFTMVLDRMPNGDVVGNTESMASACGCDYVTTATFTGRFIDCNAIRGELDLLTQRTCDDLPDQECSVMYSVGAVMIDP